MTVGEPTSYDSTFGDLGRVLTADISKLFQQTGIPTGEFSLLIGCVVFLAWGFCKLPWGIALSFPVSRGSYFVN